MTITELIAQLNSVLAKHGDVPITHWDAAEDREWPLRQENIELRTDGKSTMYDWMPEKQGYGWVSTPSELHGPRICFDS